MSFTEGTTGPKARDAGESCLDDEKLRLPRLRPDMLDAVSARQMQALPTSPSRQMASSRRTRRPTGRRNPIHELEKMMNGIRSSPQREPDESGRVRPLCEIAAAEGRLDFWGGMPPPSISGFHQKTPNFPI
jgi:hypothetical protein